MKEHQLLTLIESVIGRHSGKPSKGNHYFYCPLCNHHNPKLTIDLNINSLSFGNFNCYICSSQSGLKGNSLNKLFKVLPNVPKQKILELKSILSDIRPNSTPIKKGKYSSILSTTAGLSLPKEFIPFNTKKKVFGKKAAYDYLIKNRNFTDNDIIMYNIGYCVEGEYAGKVIIPSYDSDLKLNFFTGREFFGAEDASKHKTPSVSKDIIGFENFINWNYPITLVEGAADAITARYNAIPLFGKSIQSNLFKKILFEYVPEVNIALDPDAIKNSLTLAEQFLNESITTRLIIINEGDINNIGFVEFEKIKKKTPILTYSELIKTKIKFS